MKHLAVSYEDLETKLQSYIKDAHELEMIKAAYQFATLKHFGQKRLTGEDYIEHPLNVAYILTEISADSATICAALLHDVLEDCEVTNAVLKDQFGPEIEALVDGVTKINKLNFSGDNESMIANHRKIIVGLSEDVRVIIIKLSDRLHNMRTLWALPAKVQKEKARETLDILAPLAHRLGMNQFESELEDLSLRYYKPDVYFSIVEKLNQTKAERDQTVTLMKQNVSKLLTEHHIQHELKGRAKSIYSIYKKLDKGRKFSDIYDLLALRVYVETEDECYQALGAIHSRYRPIPKRFKDYIAMPKTNMYQSLHTTVFGIAGYLFEIQIRTYQMDEIAERGIACHWSYKEKGSSVKASMQNAMEQKLQFFRSIIELKDEEQNDEEFVNSVKEDILKNTIYVFTPKGDVVELPKGSTPIDFAYKVHSRVGDKMIGAIVNGSIVSLEYELSDNDIIKINTNQNSAGPSKEWLNIVKTTQAKNKIKSFFHKLDKDEYLKRGEDLFAKELRKKKISLNEFLTEENQNIWMKQFKLSSMEDIYLGIGTGKTTVSQLINLVCKETDSKEDIILKKTQNKEIILPIVKDDIIVRGIDQIKINVASCCKPVPGDRIVGYITKGYGITVHRMVCPNVSDLEERIIEVSWNEVTTKKYPTTILVHALENKNVLLNLISKTSNSEVSVQSVTTVQRNDRYLFEITVLIENKEELTKFMNEVETISDVLDVERSIQ